MRIPVSTLVVLSVVGATTALQFVDPDLLPMLARRPGEIADGEWWRLVTALFVHDEGLPQLAINLTAGLGLGVLVELLYGSGRWLVFYFSAGIAGNLVGLDWQPVGAGNSVAIAGLAGALFAWLLRRPGLPVQARLGAALCLAGAAILVFRRDIHGPPVLLGAALALLPALSGVAPTSGRRLR